MRAVDIGIRHQDDPVIAQLGQVKIVVDAGAQGRDDGPDFHQGQHLVRRCLFHVKNLAAQRQNGLEAPVAALFGRAAGGIALDQVNLAEAGVFFRAVGQLAGQSAAIQAVLAHDQVAGLAGGFARAGGREALIDNALRVVRVLFKIQSQPFADDALHDALDFGVAQLAFGLAFELRFGELDADDGGQAFADIVAGQVGVIFLKQLVLAGVIIEHAGQRRAEAGQMGAAVDSIDAVGES